MNAPTTYAEINELPRAQRFPALNALPMRDRLVYNIESAEAAVRRAEANTERNVAARGGWDKLSADELAGHRRTMAGLAERVENAYAALDKWDAR